MQGIQGIVYREVTVNRAFHRHDYIDNWFPIRYSINPYSGCEYGCRYCRVNWRSGKPAVPKTIITKANLPDILSRELRQLASPQIIGVGGGYNDVFSPINQKKKLTDRIILDLLRTGHRPLIMTKNPAYVLEIIDQWDSFPENQKPIIITSISSHLPSQSGDSFKLEMGAPTPSNRLAAIQHLARTSSLKVGVAFLPWLTPHRNEKLIDLMREGKKSGWSFNLLGFLKGHIDNFPHPSPTMKDTQATEQTFLSLSQSISLWPRLPPEEFLKYLSPKDGLTVCLAYQYYLGESHKKNTFRLASLGINRLSEIEFQKLYASDQLEKINGVGPVMAQIIRDFLRYQKMDYFMKVWKKFSPS